jgi:hypothetical protein
MRRTRLKTVSFAFLLRLPTRPTSPRSVRSSQACVGPTDLRQAVARPSEVDDQRQTTANAETSTCRSTGVWPAAAQLVISEYQIYDI